MKRFHREKKAALLAAFCYLAVLGLGVGMLRTAQRTRRMLYGGQPCMAQLTQKPGTDGQTEISLGGGEWELHIQSIQLDREAAEHYAALLPPCTEKYLLRLIVLADRAADQTAEWISGI